MNKERQFVWENAGALAYFMEKDMPKNLFKNTAESDTINGVTFTVNADGSITADGTASAGTSFDLTVTLQPGSYIMNGTAPGSGWSKNASYPDRPPAYRLTLRKGTGGSSTYVGADVGEGLRFKVTEASTYTLRIYLDKSVVADELVFKPMIRDANIYDGEYAPYIPSIADLEAMIEGGGGGDITSADVTAMTGYSMAQSAAAIATTDTLNEAVGKLEKGLSDVTTTIGNINTVLEEVL